MFTMMSFKQFGARSAMLGRAMPFSTAIRHNTKPKLTSPNYLLTALGISGVASGYIMAHRKIYNDSLGYSSGNQILQNEPIKVAQSNPLGDANPKYDGAFNGKLSYRQIAMGSTFGMAIGFCISRLSSVLFAFSIGVYLIGVYLKKQGIQFIDSKSVVKGAANSVNWEDLLFGQVSFSAPFILSFLFSATL